MKRRVNLLSILAHFECIIAFTLTNVEMGSALSESAWHIPGGQKVEEPRKNFSSLNSRHLGYVEEKEGPPANFQICKIDG